MTVSRIARARKLPDMLAAYRVSCIVKALGCSRTTVYDYLHGRAVPHDRFAVPLAAFLGMTEAKTRDLLAHDRRIPRAASARPDAADQ